MTLDTGSAFGGFQEWDLRLTGSNRVLVRVVGYAVRDLGRQWLGWIGSVDGYAEADGGLCRGSVLSPCPSSRPEGVDRSDSHCSPPEPIQ